MPESVYLDSCVLSRPSDDQSQERVRIETAAIAQILDAATAAQLDWVSSNILQYELSRNPDPHRRGDALDLLALSTRSVTLTQSSANRALTFEHHGLSRFDALHLALAEQAGASALLTVDDRLIRRSAALLSVTPVSVENPVNWLRRRRPWLIKP